VWVWIGFVAFAVFVVIGMTLHCRQYDKEQSLWQRDRTDVPAVNADS
jgi:hypothetical protein